MGISDELAELRTSLEKISTELADLRARVSVLESGSAPRSESREAFTIEPDSAPAQQKAQAADSHFGLAIINRIGAITLAIGIIFFFKYAVDNRWIGALGRVFIGVISGFALIGAGEWLRRRDQRTFAQGLAGCGLAALYISIYAAFAFYHLFPEIAALLAMASACAFAVVLSFQYDNPAIAALGLAGAFLTPPLLGSEKNEPWLLFPYLPLLDIASVEIALRRRWPVLLGSSFVGTAILFLMWVEIGQQGQILTGVFFLCAFFALFLFAALRALNREVSLVARFVVISNAVWALLAASLLPQHQRALTFAVFAFVICAIHLACAFVIGRVKQTDVAIYIAGHLCFAVAVLRCLWIWSADTTTPVNRTGFTSEIDSVFLALYGVVMIASAVKRRSANDRVLGLVLIGIVIIKLYFYDVWLLTRFYRITAFVALGILLLGASFIYSRWKQRTGGPNQ